MNTQHFYDGADLATDAIMLIVVSGHAYCRRSVKGKTQVLRQRYNSETDEWLDYDPQKYTIPERTNLAKLAEKARLKPSDTALLLNVTASTVTQYLRKW